MAGQRDPAALGRSQAPGAALGGHLDDRVGHRRPTCPRKAAGFSSARSRRADSHLRGGVRGRIHGFKGARRRGPARLCCSSSHSRRLFIATGPRVRAFALPRARRRDRGCAHRRHRCHHRDREGPARRPPLCTSATCTCLVRLAHRPARRDGGDTRRGHGSRRPPAPHRADRCSEHRISRRRRTRRLRRRDLEHRRYLPPYRRAHPRSTIGYRVSGEFPGNAVDRPEFPLPLRALPLLDRASSLDGAAVLADPESGSVVQTGAGRAGLIPG